ncbi:MAG: MFS transporter [Chloroflexi bacterium]|nr:MFS transporter [Chloroflexota bacterium]
MFSLPALAPELRATFGVSNAELGLLTTALMAAHAISQILSGWFIGRLGLHRAAIALGVAIGALVVSSSLVVDFSALIALRAALGLATGTTFVVGSAYVAASAPPARARTDQALYGACTSFGAALAFAMLPVWVGALGWPGHAGTTLMVVIPAIALLGRHRPSATTAIVRPVAPRRVWELAAQRQVVLLGLAHLGSFGVLVALTSWLSSLVAHSLGGDLRQSLLISAALLVFSGLARWLGGPALRRTTERRLVSGSLLMASAALVGLGLAPPLALQLALALVAIWCCSFTFAAVFQLCYDLSKPGDGPSAVGLVSAIAVAGSAILPAAFGLLTDQTGAFAAGFLLLALATGVGSVAGRLVPTR